MGITGANVRGALGEVLSHAGAMPDDLKWLVPRAQAACDAIDAAARSSSTVSTPEIEAAKKSAADNEAGFDTCHRFAYGAFELTLLKLWQPADKAARRTVRSGQSALYPDGLEITQKSWSDEADETLLFRERRKREEVTLALSVVANVVPEVDAVIGQAIAFGTALKADLRKLAELEAGRLETAQMFAARTRGMQVLALVRQNVDEVYPANNPANKVVREQLIGAYLRLLALLVDGDDGDEGGGNGGNGNGGTPQ